MKQSTSEVSKITKVYARAIFELAMERGVEEKVLEELREIDEVLVTNEELEEVLCSPLYRRVEREEVMKGIIGLSGWGEESSCLLLTIINNGRGIILRDIKKSYEKLLDSHKGIKSVYVRVAELLGVEKESELREVIEGLVGSKVRMEVEVDKKILGGIVLELDSYMIDGSLLGRIKRYEIAMRGI